MDSHFFLGDYFFENKSSEVVTVNYNRQIQSIVPLIIARI